jgi:hypothetical protein
MRIYHVVLRDIKTIFLRISIKLHKLPSFTEATKGKKNLQVEAQNAIPFLRAHYLVYP